METLEQFIKNQEEALEKKKAELAEFEKLGDIPGLTPWLIHGVLYGTRHIAFKLVDMPAFLTWAEENARDVYAVEGGYKGFYPHIPQTREYQGAHIAAVGKVVVTYSSIMHRHVVNVFHETFRISFEAPSGLLKGLAPIARWRSNHKMAKAGWFKPGGDVARQYLRVGTDSTSADLETLLTWEQFHAHLRIEA